jgi:hypothetical protein
LGNRIVPVDEHAKFLDDVVKRNRDNFCLEIGVPESDCQTRGLVYAVLALALLGLDARRAEEKLNRRLAEIGLTTKE